LAYHYRKDEGKEVNNDCLNIPSKSTDIETD
jgi:hypothetical protein